MQRQPGHQGAALESAISKARWRILPFLVCMYVLAFIDRSNVGFAKSMLQAEAGLSNAAYAFGASIFFVGYATFEIPSNLVLYRVGARVWLARIMVTWGLVAAAMAFTAGPTSFYVLRFLLGITEAGFFPGIILYLTLWFPKQTRARSMGVFYFGLPLSLVLGGPLSGVLLDVAAPFGLKSWQFMFIVERLLASLVGLATFVTLTDRPAQAGWLDDAERTALVGTIRNEDDARRARRRRGRLQPRPAVDQPGEPPVRPARRQGADARGRHHRQRRRPPPDAAAAPATRAGLLDTPRARPARSAVETLKGPGAAHHLVRRATARAASGMKSSR